MRSEITNTPLCADCGHPQVMTQESRGHDVGSGFCYVLACGCQQFVDPEVPQLFEEK